MRWDEFPKWGRWAADWAGRYHAGLRDRPVRARTKPGEVLAALPAHPPETAQPMDQIIADFESIVMPGITHWQHPRFFAYFPSNASPAAVLADHLVTVMAPQCMLWQTSPAATEMETRMMDWLRQSIGLPDGFAGVIQDRRAGDAGTGPGLGRECQRIAGAENPAGLLFGGGAFLGRPCDLDCGDRTGQSGANPDARPVARDGCGRP